MTVTAPRSTPTASSRRSTRRSRSRSRKRFVVAFGPPAIPGLGTGAGFTMQLQDRRRAVARTTWPSRPSVSCRPHVSGRRSGASPRCTARRVPQVYADIDRSKVLKARRAARGRQQHARRAARQHVRQRLQPVRARLQGVRAGRAGVPARSEAVRAVLRARQGRADGAARHAGDDAADERPGVHQPVQPVSLGRTDRRARRRATARRRRSARSRRSRGEVLPADMGYDWADMSYQEKRAPNPAIAFAFAIFLVFLVLAAQYESWALPFSVLLGTPFAAFGAYFGLWCGAAVDRSQLREQRLRADRPDHADRPGREERHPDRRVREDAARAGQGSGDGRARSGAAAVPADPDDRVRVHPRRGAAAHGDRRRRRGAQGHGHDGVLRHAHRDLPRGPARSPCSTSRWRRSPAASTCQRQRTSRRLPPVPHHGAEA